MHDMIYSIYDFIFFMECGTMCVRHCMCIQVESNPCRKIHLLGIAHLDMGKYCQALEVQWGMECIQDLSGEEKGRFDFVLYFVNFGWKAQFCFLKRTEL